MAGWDGMGNFTVPYNFVQDAANSIPILAAKQDTQWATVVAGLMLCQTRDGQNKPIANWDFNGFKITNLAAPVNPTDVARLADVISVPAGEWLSESNPFTFVNATSFKLTGANLTARYEVGRRLKITHNTGGTTSYYTITSSSFGAGDTTVNVSGPTLVTSLTAVAYAMLDAANSSVPVPSAVGIFANAVGAAVASGSDYVIGGSVPFPGTTVTGDIYNEIVSGVFTAKYTGLYLVNAVASFVQAAGFTVTGGKLVVLKNGGALHANSPAAFSHANSFSIPYSTAQLTDMVSLNAGETLQVKTSGFTCTGFGAGGGGLVTILRVR